jgi:tetratricopeptide (TPR) repeat protein
MAIITIRETTTTDGGWQAALSFDGEGDFALSLRNPFADPQDEALLAWYFEQHLRFPFLDHDKANAARASITDYGHALFGQVFADPGAYARYWPLAQQGLEGVQVEVIGSAGFHRLHWEALKDPKLPMPLVLRAPLVRRSPKVPMLPAALRESPTLNLLVVSARPYGRRDVGYRTISRPLVEQLRQAAVKVRVDIVRPGTYEALLGHLEEASTEHGHGFYHVVHFDVHGALLTAAQLADVDGLAPGQLAYDADPAGSAQATVQRAYLFFEGPEEGQAVPVVDGELANLLSMHGIPVAILNACQSGMQAGDSEANLANQLLQAGVQLTVGMCYSVTVSAAEQMMPVFYRELFAGRDPGTALRLARVALHQDKARRGYFGRQVELEDWMLPVAYQHRQVRFQPRPFTEDEEARYYQELAEAYQEPEPEYGFIGRDLDVAAIEGRVLKRNVLLVQGMGGAGKTTLLRHLGAWWQTTELVDRVFEYAYDQRPWTAEQILRDIAQRLLSRVEFARYEALGLPAQQAMLAERLRAQRHLLILDNLESVAGSPMAIPNTLPPAKQAALRGLVASLVGGRTIALLGSRGREPWLAKGTFADNIYELGGLDEEAASLLAERVLERYGLARYRTDPGFGKLLGLLDGFPLAITVVLANLARQSPTEVLKALEEATLTVEAAPGGVEDKTASILRCIEYSHANLAPQAQRLLACLAPFTSVVYTPILELYGHLLRAQPPLADLPADEWQNVLAEAEAWGLVRRDQNISGFLQLQPVFPYFLRTRLQGDDHAIERQAIDTAYRQLYEEFASGIGTGLSSNDAQERQFHQVLAEREQANIRHALHLALEAKTSILQIFLPIQGYLVSRNALAESTRLSQDIVSELERYPAEVLAGPIGLDLLVTVGELATMLLKRKELNQAKAEYERCLDLCEQLSASFSASGMAELIPVVLRGKGNVYHGLGRVAEEQRRWQEAETNYGETLRIYDELNDRHSKASIYHQLGMIAQDQRRWQEAEAKYQEAREIYDEFDDLYEQGDVYLNLGVVAQNQQRMSKAEENFRKALEIFDRFNDLNRQASVYSNLGGIAQDREHWREAEALFRRALEIRIEFEDRFGQATIYYRLGGLAQTEKRWQEAEANFRKALEIFAEFDARHSQAMTQWSLGDLALEVNDRTNALSLLIEALGGFNALGDADRVTAVLASLAELWRDGDSGIPAAVAQAIGINAGEAEQLLRR